MGMTKDLRQVQMREAQLLMDKVKIEVEIAEKQKSREEERWHSERRKHRLEESRVEMLFLLCKKEYNSTLGVEYRMSKVMNSFHFLVIIVFAVLRIRFI